MIEADAISKSVFLCRANRTIRFRSFIIRPVKPPDTPSVLHLGEIKWNSKLIFHRVPPRFGKFHESSNPEFFNPNQILLSRSLVAACPGSGAKSGWPHGCGNGAVGFGRFGTVKSGRSKSKARARLVMSRDASRGVRGARFQRHSMNLRTDV